MNVKTFCGNRRKFPRDARFRPLWYDGGQIRDMSEVKVEAGMAQRGLSSFQIITVSFAAAILTGAALLLLPFASHGGAGVMDALFTAVSAVCVTGLVTVDTGTYWTFFGQLVILLLIQTGGMGVVTFAMMIAVYSGRRVSLMQRSTLQEAVAAPQLGGLVQILRLILRGTLLFEGLGALAMAPVFIADFGWARGLWFAVFHSISAFCNAGFDLTGILAPGSSLVYYADHPVINGTIMALIVAGGLGFLTWADLLASGGRLSRCRLQTKMILAATAGLIFIPAAVFYACDFAGLDGRARVLAALFQSVTARTAGFNSVDLTAMTEAGRMILVVLMFIGGGPGSTAGGIKTTTFFTLLAAAIATFRLRRDVECFGRRIAPESIRQALTVLLLYLTLLLAGSLFVSYREGLPFLDCLFECASAIGTVGLTVGVTAEAGVLSRCVLMALMFFGRVGALTLIYAAHRDSRSPLARLPEEKVAAG